MSACRRMEVVGAGGRKEWLRGHTLLYVNPSNPLERTPRVPIHTNTDIFDTHTFSSFFAGSYAVRPPPSTGSFTSSKTRANQRTRLRLRLNFHPHSQIAVKRQLLALQSGTQSHETRFLLQRNFILRSENIFTSKPNPTFPLRPPC